MQYHRLPPNRNPTPGQTVGPFYGYALPYPGDSDLVPVGHSSAIRLHGTVYDGAGSPVPDALLEIWQTNAAGRYVDAVESERALRVVAEEAAKLAQVVSVVTAVLDPGLIVLAGGIGRNADLLADPIRQELAATIPLVPDIVGGRLGDDAVLVGAIATAMDTAWDLVFDRRVLGRAASEA